MMRESYKCFFHQKGNSKPLDAKTPNNILKAMLRSIGVDPTNYGSHSARRGAVTAALERGISIHVVARHGNWKSTAVYAYVVDSIEKKLKVGKAILGSQLRTGNFIERNRGQTS